MHGWRDFLTEMTVIVVGILIALTGEQLVETLHWHHVVKQTESELTRELAGNMSAVIARLRTAACVEKRLDQIAAAVDGGAASGKLQPMGALQQPVGYLWGHGDWDSAVASQTTSHFPSERLASYGVAFQFIRKIEDTHQRELESWAELSTLVGPGRPFDSSSAASARSAVSRARFFSREIAEMGMGLLQRIKALNLPFDQTAHRRIEGQLHQPLGNYAICQPMGTEISPTYGQAPFNDTLSAAEKTIKDLDH